MNDAVGQELRIGDFVAYVHRYGSSVRIDKRQITGVHPSGLLSLDHGRGQVQPYNVAKIEAQE